MRAVLVGVMVVVFAGALAAQPGAEVFTSTEGKFAVRFPGKPKVTPQTSKTALGEMKGSSATFATADLNVYLAGFAEFPAGKVKAENAKSLFDGARDSWKGSKGEIVSEKDFEFGPDKLPGREVIVDKDKGKQRIRLRTVLRDNRLYQLAVIGPADFVSGKDATAFIESWELTK